MSRLDRFVADARQRIRSGYYHTQGAPLAPPCPFTSVLGRPAGLVAELKPRSPSEGVLFSGDPKVVLEDFLAGGADGLSVLADADHFDGSIENLRLAHETGLPVLFKDFVVDETQLDCAKHHGCAAVLLIERILTPARREALVAAAHERGLQVLLEIHSATEWQTAHGSQADIIGVNARDLDSLSLDPVQQQAVVEAVSRTHPVMSLSGIQCRADRIAAESAGASAVLVGTHLMRHPHRRLALTALRRPLAKVCGLTRRDDLADAIAAGADLVGAVVLSPDSPRNNDVATAAMLLHEVDAATVMVTRSTDSDAVIQAASRIRPTFVQWHGAPADAQARLHTLDIGFLAALRPGEAPPACDGMVLDNATTLSGGTGETHDWEQARRMVAQHKGLLSLIAGGLHADNAAAALQATQAWGADASSLLETRPGIKDAAKVKAFVMACH